MFRRKNCTDVPPQVVNEEMIGVMSVSMTLEDL
jgi:hypothetical protein